MLPGETVALPSVTPSKSGIQASDLLIRNELRRGSAMDEVKIWALDGDSKVTPLASRDRTDTESLLEETLVRNPDLLIPGLEARRPADADGRRAARSARSG